MKIILNTSFEVRTLWFQLFCRHRRYATREMPHLFICHAHVTNVPHIIHTRSVYYIGTSVTSFVPKGLGTRLVRHPLRIQRTETKCDFLLRDLVLAMVCVKKNSPLAHTPRSRGHGHEVIARRSLSRLQTRLTRGHI